MAAIQVTGCMRATAASRLTFTKHPQPVLLAHRVSNAGPARPRIPVSMALAIDNQRQNLKSCLTIRTSRLEKPDISVRYGHLRETPSRPSFNYIQE